MNLNQVTMPTNDMEATNAFYLLLGFRQIVDTPHYARFECPTGDATFSLSLVDELKYNPTIIYFEHEELDEWANNLLDKGLSFDEMPQDMSFLWREAKLTDPAGNKIKLYWAGENRKNPPWRVDITK